MRPSFLKNIIVMETISTTVLNAVGRGIGFIIPVFIANWFGISAGTDIFFFIYGSILYLADIFAQSLESNIIPFIGSFKQRNEDELPVFLNRLMTLALCSMAVATVILLIFAKPIFILITHFPALAHHIIFRLVLITSPLLLLLTLSGIFSGILNAYFKFWAPAISPGIRAVICILTIIVLKDKLGIYSVALGYVLGEVARLIFFVIAVLKYKIATFRIDFSFDAKLIGFFKTMAFQVAGMVAVNLNPIIDKAMASWLYVGSVSVLQYAERLYFIPIAFISFGVLTVLFSHWSEDYHNKKNIEVLVKDLKKGIFIMIATGIMMTLILLLFSRQLVGIAYGRGKFPLELLGTVNVTFLCYLAGITFYFIRQLAVKAHLVMHDTRILMKSALFSNILNIILNFFLMRYLGTAGIALATTIVSVLMFFYLYHMFNVKVARMRLEVTDNEK